MFTHPQPARLTLASSWLAMLFLLASLKGAAAGDGPAPGSSPASGASPVNELAAGGTVEGTLEAGRTMVFNVVASEGDYVRGSVAGEGITLTLWNDENKKVRQLYSGAGPVQEFHFVVDGTGLNRLQATAEHTGSFRIHLSTIVPLADQKGPAEKLESPFLRQLQADLEQGGDSAAFWKQVEDRGTPLVELENVLPPLKKDYALVTFLLRGARQHALLFAAPSGDHDPMQRLGDSDVWYASYRVPMTGRIAYKLAPDVPAFDAPPFERRRAILATAQLDPFNKKSFPPKPVDRFLGESVIELPHAPAQPWVAENPATPKGRLSEHRFRSEILGNERNVALYRSPGYVPGQDGNWLLLVFDGDRYVRDVSVPVVLDNLVAAGWIPPTAAIFVSNPSPEARAKELPCNPDFARCLSEELMPWAKDLGVQAKASRTVVVGASYGGLAAAYVGLKHPELFGNVLSQSGSFWWTPGASPFTTAGEPEWLAREVIAMPLQPVKFYVEAGLFEDHQLSSILDTSRHFRDVLQAKGYDVRYRESASGHGYYYWRFSFPDALLTLIGD